MKTVFVDTVYWIASVRPDDQWGQSALEAREDLGPTLMVTTDEVLTEFLAALSRGGPRIRVGAVAAVQAILSNPYVDVVPQSRESFLTGLDRYRARSDKAYSLQDCISMIVMESKGITEILTSDRHFEQEGFRVLMRNRPN